MLGFLCSQLIIGNLSFDVDGGAPLPARRLRGDPEQSDGGGASMSYHRADQDRLRLQHRADVASVAPGRGLRPSGYHDQGPDHIWRRAWLS